MFILELAFMNNLQIPFFDSFTSSSLFIFIMIAILLFFFIDQSLFLMLFLGQMTTFIMPFTIMDDLFILCFRLLIKKVFIIRCLVFLLFFKLEIMIFKSHHQEKETDLHSSSILQKFAFFILNQEEILANSKQLSFFYQFTMNFKQCVYGFSSALLY